MGFRHLYPINDSSRYKYGHEYHRPLEQEKISTKSVLNKGYILKTKP